MKKTITITAQHIAQGERGNACDCPAARGFRDAGVSASVNCSTVDFYHRRDPSVFVASRNTPDPLEDFVSRFDAGKSVKAVTFEMDIPEEALE